MARKPPINSMNSPRNRNCRAIILWSVEKMYVRTNPSSWCSWTSCAVAAALGCAITVSLAGSARPLLLQPGLVVLGGVDVEEAPHTRVPEPAQLGTGHLVLVGRSGLGGLLDLDPLQDLAAGHRVLLEARVREVHAVDHVSRPDVEDDRLAHRHVELVVEGLVVLGVELAVRAGVGDFPVELL